MKDSNRLTPLVESFLRDPSVWFDLQSIYNNGEGKGCDQHKLLEEIMMVAGEIVDGDRVA